MNKNHPEVIDALHRKQHEVSGRSRWRRWALPAVGGIALTLVVVALFVPVEMSVTAPGTVVPSARVKSVQHLEGGIVRELFVREGQSVREGDRLVRMELGAQGPNLEEISAKVSALHAARLRLDAEASGKAISSEMFGDDTAPMVARTEQLTHEARLLELQGQLAAARAQVEMFNGRAGEVEAKIEGHAARAALLEREYGITRDLANEKLVSDLEATRALKDLESNRAEMAAARQALLAARASAAESRGKVAEAEGRFRRRASEELLAIERQIATANEELHRAQDQRNRTLLVAPIAGVVKGLRLTESGGVVKPGETLMEVVPADAEIELEVRLHPKDRGLVLVDQPVQIKVSAYDFLRFGSLKGRVLRIAADADQDPATGPFFRMVVQTEGSELGKSRLPVTPGMQADVDIIIGHQPFAWYLLRPVLKVGAEAFREP
ncbi:HlyD family type I secretion periplasmic adaptor subunit [Hydrogenophaga sp. D2P1]|uniref:Membrane fusion protein (MFP) family protein n=1 Tax=Hydrogenophaga aromaticivorans TaxID=2610898 RepID=A0A7Y8GUD2_9BURK|nr:HlyD family type I secretion periplasmic adaptor subunit [Hydrogenophaga aromaticivorans]NWF44282.1 HlyD family type I secretion periplasmic adaptor subunit [Hydrogenophaga aromaticivorans]